MVAPSVAVLLVTLPAPFKVVDHLGYSPEPVYTADLFFKPLGSQPVPHRGARLDDLQSNAACGEFIGESAKRLGAVQVHVGRSR